MMKYAFWLLASSLGVGLACNVAAAEDAPPSFPYSPLIGVPRTIPTPGPKGQKAQSPEATACANASAGVPTPKGRFDACTKLIDSGMWQGKDIAWAYANRCVARAVLKQLADALGDCDKAVALAPDVPLNYQIRAELLEKRSEPEKALADYRKAAELGGNSPTIFVNLGNILVAKGEFETAQAEFTRAIDLDDKNSLAFLDRAGARLNAGDSDSALEDYNKTIELNPRESVAWFNRGAIFFERGDRDKAVADFRQALKLNPANAYAALWTFIARGSDDAKAKAELKTDAAKFSQSWPGPVVQFYLGEKDAARTLAAATTPGDQCEAQFYVGQERLLQKANGEALPYLRKAVETCPRDFIEAFHAKAELKKLDPASAAPEAPKANVAPKADETPKAAPPSKAEEAPKADAAPKADEPPKSATKGEEAPSAADATAKPQQ